MLRTKENFSCVDFFTNSQGGRGNFSWVSNKTIPNVV